MKASAATFSLLVLGAAGSAFAQPAPLLKPGLWETTTVIEDAGSTTRRSIVGRTCLQASDAANAQKVLPAQRERALQCENHDVRQDGSTVTWKIACRSPEANQSGSGRLALGGDSYLGRAELELQRKGAKAVPVKQTFSGKWLQGCA